MSSITATPVAVKCLVYNHGPYLEQCLAGFVSQETSFPFKVFVHDDASTDNSLEIIYKFAKKYPDIIIPITETVNQFSLANRANHIKINKAINNLPGCKYIAFCEGDDFWTDSHKLQQQYDFMESHPEYGMCFTNHRILRQKSGHIYTSCNKRDLPADGQYLNYLLLQHNPIGALTAFYKKNLYFDYVNEIKPENTGWKMGDFPFWLWIAERQKIGYLKRITATYRYLDNSLSHSTNNTKLLQFQQSNRDVQEFFAKRNNIILPPWDKDFCYYQICLNSLRSNYTTTGAATFQQSYRQLRSADKTFIRHLLYMAVPYKALFYCSIPLIKLNNYFNRITKRHA